MAKAQLRKMAGLSEDNETGAAEGSSSNVKGTTSATEPTTAVDGQTNAATTLQTTSTGTMPTGTAQATHGLSATNRPQSIVKFGVSRTSLQNSISTKSNTSTTNVNQAPGSSEHITEVDGPPIDIRLQPLTPSSDKNGKKRKAKKPMTRKTRKPKVANTDAKGDPANAKSFLEAWKSEPKLAAYTGYADLGELRKFQLSNKFLSIYLPYRQHVPSVSAKVALELLTDERTRTKVSSLNDTLKAFPIKENPSGRLAKSQHAKNQGYVLAAILYALASLVERGIPDRSDEEARERQSTALSELSKATGQMMPAYPSSANVKLHLLGLHTNVEEHLLEKYNRAYTLLREFSQLLEPQR